MRVNTKIVIEVRRLEFVEVTVRPLESIIITVLSGKVSAWKLFFGGWSRVFLMGWVELHVTLHVAAAAGGHLEYVHVQTQTTVPSQQSVVIVHLHARRTIVVGYERATGFCAPENINNCRLCPLLILHSEFCEVYANITRSLIKVL